MAISNNNPNTQTVGNGTNSKNNLLGNVYTFTLAADVFQFGSRWNGDLPQNHYRVTKDKHNCVPIRVPENLSRSGH